MPRCARRRCRSSPGSARGAWRDRLPTWRGPIRRLPCGARRKRRCGATGRVNKSYDAAEDDPGMTFQSETLGVPPTGLPVLLELVHERTGLFFDNGRSDMFAERMAPLVVERGFRSFLDLYYLLKYDDASGDQGWRQVLDALSVPETYFWREIDQIRAVVCRVVPELVRRSRGPIRIWSAPCATGEEPLTIAMALDEAGWFDRVVDRDQRQRRQPGGDRQGAGRALPAARDARRCRPRSRRSISSPTATRSFRGPSWPGGFRHGAS